MCSAQGRRPAGLRGLRQRPGLGEQPAEEAPAAGGGHLRPRGRCDARLPASLLLSVAMETTVV